MWETLEHIALVAIIINTCVQVLDIIVYKTIIHKEWKVCRTKT
jgi:hypothetical protein